jgi:hypothetical protein
VRFSHHSLICHHSPVIFPPLRPNVFIGILFLITMKPLYLLARNYIRKWWKYGYFSSVHNISFRSLDSAVNIVTMATRLQAGRPRSRSPIPGRGKRFLSSPGRGLRPTQAPIQWVPGTVILGVKRQGLETDHSPPSNTAIMNGEPIPSHPDITSWRAA